MPPHAEALPEQQSGVHRVDLAPDNLCEALRRAGRGRRGVVLVAGDETEQRRTWAELYDGAMRRAAGLRERGLERGDVVVLVLDTSFEFVETFFGVMLAGGVPAPAYPPVAMARLASYVELLGHIVRATDARFLVTDAQIGNAIASVGREPSLAAIVDVAELEGRLLRRYTRTRTRSRNTLAASRSRARAPSTRRPPAQTGTGNQHRARVNGRCVRFGSRRPGSAGHGR